MLVIYLGSSVANSGRLLLRCRDSGKRGAFFSFLSLPFFVSKIGTKKWVYPSCGFSSVLCGNPQKLTPHILRVLPFCILCFRVFVGKKIRPPAATDSQNRPNHRRLCPSAYFFLGFFRKCFNEWVASFQR